MLHDLDIEVTIGWDDGTDKLARVEDTDKCLQDACRIQAHSRCSLPAAESGNVSRRRRQCIYPQVAHSYIPRPEEGQGREEENDGTNLHADVLGIGIIVVLHETEGQFQRLDRTDGWG